MHVWIVQVSGVHVVVTFFVAQRCVCSKSNRILQLGVSPSLRLCFLACFAVHCCVSKLYWHSPRLLPLPHHLCRSPSLLGPLSPEWLTRIFNFSVYLSLLCLKQHWYRLRARWRLRWCVCVCDGGVSAGGGGGEVTLRLDGVLGGDAKMKEVQKERTGLSLLEWNPGGGGVRGRRRSKWVVVGGGWGVEEELRWYFCTVTQTDSAEGMKGERGVEGGKERSERLETTVSREKKLDGAQNIRRAMRYKKWGRGAGDLWGAERGRGQ